MCSGGAPLVRCFGGFALCVPMVWSPSCVPCEESVRALLSSDLVSVLCWTFDHLWSLFCFVVDFFFLFHMVTVCVTVSFTEPTCPSYQLNSHAESLQG